VKTQSFLFFLLLIIVLLYSSCKIKPELYDIARFNIAITNNDIDTVKYYLKRYKNISNAMLSVKPILGYDEHLSPIMQSVYYNKEGTEILELLVRNGGNIHFLNEKNMDAIQFASLYENTKALLFLIDKGADINSKDINNETSLFSAVVYKNLEIMQILLENGADVNIKSNINNYSVYHFIPWLEDISTEMRKEMYNMLIQYDASSFDSLSASGHTPFSFTLSFGQYDMIDFFLEHGASVNKALNCGDTYLGDLLHIYNKEYIIKLLNNCDGFINGKNENGNTLLMLGILSENDQDIEYETLKFLAEKSENIDQKNDEGATAFMLAVAMNRLDIARLLIDMGADKYHKNNMGLDAINYHEHFQREFGNPINPEVYKLF